MSSVVKRDEMYFIDSFRPLKGVKMNLDSAYIDSFIDDFKKIMKEREQEIINEKFLILPCGALTAYVIRAATYISNYLDRYYILEPDEKLDPRVKLHVKYMAIELFDKFMNKSFWEAYNANAENNHNWFEAYKKTTCDHLKLYLVSCFQLACKMDSHANSLGKPQILELLAALDQNYKCTQEMVSVMEKEIFKKVEFKMPLYTPVHCIEILLTATGIGETPKTVDISMQLLDLAYLKHEKLYYHFESYLEQQNILMSKEEKELKLRILKSNTLFLSAVIVLCTTHFFPSGINDIDINVAENMADNLAKLTDTESTEIIIMSNILLQIMQYS